MKTVKQVAEYLTVSETIVYRLIESGEMKAHRIGIGRGTIRVSDEQLKDYLEAVETGPEKSSTMPSPKFRHLSP